MHNDDPYPENILHNDYNVVLLEDDITCRSSSSCRIAFPVDLHFQLHYLRWVLLLLRRKHQCKGRTEQQEQK